VGDDESPSTPELVSRMANGIGAQRKDEARPGFLVAAGRTDRPARGRSPAARRQLGRGHVAGAHEVRLAAAIQPIAGAYRDRIMVSLRSSLIASATY
jgi:hypothetical protein